MRYTSHENAKPWYQSRCWRCVLLGTCAYCSTGFLCRYSMGRSQRHPRLSFTNSRHGAVRRGRANLSVCDRKTDSGPTLGLADGIRGEHSHTRVRSVSLLFLIARGDGVRAFGEWFWAWRLDHPDDAYRHVQRLTCTSVREENIHHLVVVEKSRLHSKPLCRPILTPAPVRLRPLRGRCRRLLVGIWY